MSTLQRAKRNGWTLRGCEGVEIGAGPPRPERTASAVVTVVTCCFVLDGSQVSCSVEEQSFVVSRSRAGTLEGANGTPTTRLIISI